MPMIENGISMSIKPHQVSTLPFERSEFIKASSDSNENKNQLHYLKIIYFIRDRFEHKCALEPKKAYIRGGPTFGPVKYVKDVVT